MTVGELGDELAALLKGAGLGQRGAIIYDQHDYPISGLCLEEGPRILSRHVLVCILLSFEATLVKDGKALALPQGFLSHDLPRLAALICRCPSHCVVLNFDEVVHQFQEPLDAERYRTNTLVIRDAMDVLGVNRVDDSGTQKEIASINGGGARQYYRKNDEVDKIIISALRTMAHEAATAIAPEVRAVWEEMHYTLSDGLDGTAAPGIDDLGSTSGAGQEVIGDTTAVLKPSRNGTTTPDVDRIASVAESENAEVGDLIHDEAVQWCAHACNTYGLDPQQIRNIGIEVARSEDPVCQDPECAAGTPRRHSTAGFHATVART